MKPGIKTSEFWLSLVALVATQAQPVVQQVGNSEWNAGLAAAIAGIYTFSRAYAKAKEPNAPAA